MKQLFQRLRHLASENRWIFHLFRCTGMLFLGVLILLKPAAALYLCAFLLAFQVFFLLLRLTLKYTSPCRHALWSFFLIVPALLALPRHYDMAAIFFGALTAFITGASALGKKNIFNLITAAAAFAAGAVLLVKSFFANWFDLYAAVGMLFFASAAWESSNIAFPFLKKK